MKKLLFLLSLILLVSCSKEDIVRERSGRTVLAYFIADNNLGSDFKNNIISMYKGMQNVKDTCTLLIFCDTGTSYDKSLFYYFPNPCILEYVSYGNGKVNNTSNLTDETDILNAAKVVKTYSSPILSTDKYIMTEVIKDMKSLSKTKEYGLIFGSHGSGWLKYIDGSNSRSFGQDGNYTSNTITIPDMSYALSQAGGNFKYIMFDACMMANVETFYELRNVCDYLIGTPFESPGQGYPYDEIMPYLFSSNVTDYTQKMLDKITDNFSQIHSQNLYDKDGWGVFITVDASQLDPFAKEYSSLIKQYKDNIQNVSNSKLQNYTSGTFSTMSYDLKDYFLNLTNNDIPQSFISQLNKTVVGLSYVIDSKTGLPYFLYISLKSNDLTRLCGLGMYIPYNPAYYYWAEYFRTLSWATVSGWNDILGEN